MAELTAEVIGLEVLPYGGFRVKTTATHHIEVYRMLFNWRLVTTPVDLPVVHDHGWCYFGTDFATLTRAVLAAKAWDGKEGTEPIGYDKRAF